jgi:AcrR family transcriptional regulator
VSAEKKRPGRPRVEGLTERRSEEILAVATRVFAKKTFRGTDVQEIADLVGVGKGTIYRYFHSKDELFLAAVSRLMERLDDVIDPIVRSEASARERLEQIVESWMAFFDADPDMVELLIQERAEFRDRGQLTFFDYRRRLLEEAPDLTRELAEEGVLRHDPDDKRYEDILCELLYGLLFTWHFTGCDDPLEERSEVVRDILFHGILKPA